MTVFKVAQSIITAAVHVLAETHNCLEMFWASGPIIYKVLLDGTSWTFVDDVSTAAQQEYSTTPSTTAELNFAHGGGDIWVIYQVLESFAGRTFSKEEATRCRRSACMALASHIAADGRASSCIKMRLWSTGREGPIVSIADRFRSTLHSMLLADAHGVYPVEDKNGMKPLNFEVFTVFRKQTLRMRQFSLIPMS